MYTIHQLPISERPRERMLQSGAESLSSAELIAIILGSGMKGKSVLELSKELLIHFGGLKKLQQASVEELCEIKGLGSAKAIQLKAAFSLGVKVASLDQSIKYQIKSPFHAYNFVKEQIEEKPTEHLLTVLLNTRGVVIGAETVAIGTLSEVLIHPREVFYPAVRRKAATIILTHNHPSGDPTPSDEDIRVTEELVQAGKLLGIPVQDHLVIGNREGGYISIKEKFEHLWAGKLSGAL